MDIINFFKGMLPSFSRARIQEDLRSVRDEHSTIVMPSLLLADKEIKTLKSDEARALAKSYYSIMGGNGNLFSDLVKNFKKIEAIYAPLEVNITTEFGDRVVPAALSGRTANVLRLVNVLAFENRFVMSLINAVMHFECKESGLGMSMISDVTPGEMERLTQGMIDFAQIQRALISVKNPQEALEEIPDIQIENVDVTRSMQGKVDPFGIFKTGMGFRGNLSYYVVMAVSDYQHERYKKMEAQKRSLEKRIIAMKRMQAGNPSAQAEEELEVLTSNIARLDAKLRDYERKNA